MSRLFIDPGARVPVTVGENTVYIRAKMDAGTLALVQDAVQARQEGDGSAIVGIGTYRLLLLAHNILAWEGPDFRDESGAPVPCTRANISRLDPTTPLFEAVGAKIGELNAAATVPADELEQHPN